MRIATWNVNGLRARLEFVLHWLRDRQPDIVGLQELKLEDEQFPHDVFQEAGYFAATHGQKAWNGVAILSRDEAQVEQRGLPGEDAFGSRLITARVGGLQFTTVYCPNGKTIQHEDYPKKLAWYDSLAAYLDETLDREGDSVICGDFNICPAPIDSHNEAALHGAIFHTDAERERFRALLDRGLVDLFREKYPKTQTFSWWDYRGGAFHRNLGLRIDFLLGTSAVMQRVVDVETDRDYRKKKDGLTASDHAPVIATLD